MRKLALTSYLDLCRYSWYTVDVIGLSQKRWLKTAKGRAYVARQNRRYRTGPGREKLRIYEQARYQHRRGMSLGEFRRWAYTIKLKSAYKLSREEYDAMVIGSLGLCAICYKPPKQGLDLDHDHISGKARGLLCRNCNSIIGKAEPYWLNIMSYLRI